MPNPDTPSQMVADFRSEDVVATVDGVLDITQNVGQADLMVLRQFLLAGISVAHPNVRIMTRHHHLGDRLRPAGCDLMKNDLVRGEAPLPLRDAADARGCFIRGDDRRFAQSSGNGFRGRGFFVPPPRRLVLLLVGRTGL